MTNRKQRDSGAKKFFSLFNQKGKFSQRSGAPGESRDLYEDFWGYLADPSCRGIKIETDSKLLESKTVRVGRFTARRDPPHFQGDVTHAHVKVSGGFKVAWDINGKRRHLSKFPATVPKGAKVAIASVLGVGTDLLEAYWIEEGAERRLLFESISADR